MIKRLIFIFLFCAHFLNALEISEPYSQTANPLILEKSYQIFKNIHKTSYSLNSSIDEVSGIYDTNCSAFLSYILSFVSPHALFSLSIEPEYDYPRAFSFYQTIVASESMPASPWQRIHSIHDACPGDILAWRIHEEIQPFKNTGHVVILLDAPHMQPDGTFICRVFDAASLPHANDSRPQGTNGVGIGEIRILADNPGAPIAYYWSNRQKKPRFKPMAIGRIHLSVSPLHSPSFEDLQCPAMHPQEH